MARKGHTQYVAVDPEGGRHTRTSARVYTHAVLVFSDGSWGAWSWCGRPDLAQKQANRFLKYQPGRPVEIVPLDAEV